MYALRITVLVIHIVSAALLFGAPMGIVRNARKALGLNPDAFRMAAADAARRGNLAQIGSTLTLFSGLGLIFIGGGFAMISPTIHGALALMFVAIVAMYTVTRPGIRALLQASESEEPDKESAGKAIKRIAMGTGIGHALWLVILVLMLIKLR